MKTQCYPLPQSHQREQFSTSTASPYHASTGDLEPSFSQLSLNTQTKYTVNQISIHQASLGSRNKFLFFQLKEIVASTLLHFTLAQTPLGQLRVECFSTSNAVKLMSSLTSSVIIFTVERKPSQIVRGGIVGFFFQ